MQSFFKNCIKNVKIRNKMHVFANYYTKSQETKSIAPENQSANRLQLPVLLEEIPNQIMFTLRFLHTVLDEKDNHTEFHRDILQKRKIFRLPHHQIGLYNRASVVRSKDDRCQSCGHRKRRQTSALAISCLPLYC